MQKQRLKAKRKVGIVQIVKRYLNGKKVSNIISEISIGYRILQKENIWMEIRSKIKFIQNMNAKYYVEENFGRNLV